VQQILARIQAEAADEQIISARLLPTQAAGEAVIEVDAVAAAVEEVEEVEEVVPVES